MQTFLPYPSFRRSARSLDRLRLGKQRKECLWILEAIDTGSSHRRWNHPAVQMWRYHKLALIYYYNEIVNEWVQRGYKDNGPKLRQLWPEASNAAMPPWIGKRKFHDAHKSKLFGKDKKHYAAFKAEGKKKLKYEWPILNLDKESGTVHLYRFEHRGEDLEAPKKKTRSTKAPPKKVNARAPGRPAVRSSKRLPALQSTSEREKGRGRYNYYDALEAANREIRSARRRAKKPSGALT